MHVKGNAGHVRDDKAHIYINILTTPVNSLSEKNAWMSAKMHILAV